MALGHEECTAFRTKLGLYESMFLPLGHCNAPDTFKRDINRILRSLSGFELVIKTDVLPDEDKGMVVVAYIDDITIATKGNLEKQHRQVSKVFQLFMDNQMCVSK